MISTNPIPDAQAMAQNIQSTFNAWHLVALLAGGVVIHCYHCVVRAGGCLAIWRRFVYGPAQVPAPAAAPVSTPTAARTATPEEGK